jgi:predicted nucleic acid-binding protein
VTVYADTSWWIACKITDDSNHAAATSVFDLWPETRIVWTPWQRLEIFNGLRQLERAGVVSAGKSRELIRLLEQEVRLGYWPHAEFDWRGAVRTACELSAEHGLSVPMRSMDVFHVAIAIEVGADALLTFDREQQALAEAAGVRVLKLGARRRG